MVRHLLIRAAWPLAALMAAAAITFLNTATADAATRTGTWAGTLKQDLRDLDEPYTTSLTVQAYKGRISQINVEVRMECGDDRIVDAHAFKSYRTRRGPKISRDGGFHLNVKSGWYNSSKTAKISVGGELGRKRGGGNASASDGNCSGRGGWSAKRIN